MAALSARRPARPCRGPSCPSTPAPSSAPGCRDELDAQLRRGHEVLAVARASGSTPPAGPGWRTARLDQAAVDQLAPRASGTWSCPRRRVGTHRARSPRPSPSPCPGHGSRHGASTARWCPTPGSAARLAAGDSGDPALAAVQIAGRALLIYYEAPNLEGPAERARPRGAWWRWRPPAWAPSAHLRLRRPRRATGQPRDRSRSPSTSSSLRSRWAPTDSP